ncbi:hypothetical protein [Roseiconus nitratireducens]|uniref:hypothetical protein n=1 Tax=Roseiconus nitratireducens TaxID=2605748 RepID=UPI001F3BAFFA|nr:hypothetical protein [Roseiconus nitratireducens]
MNVSFGQPFRRLAFGLLLASSVAVPAQAGFGLFDHGCDTNCDTPSCGTSLCETSLCESAACDMGCDGGCDAGCGCGGQLGCLSNLDALGCGLIKPSDHCFDDFISPMINFVHFEDPRTLTEIRPIFVNHWVPDNIGSGIPAGGSIQLLALQFRVALTERLSLIGVKDGYIFDSTDNALDTLLDDGWAAVTAGLKYNLLRDTRSGTLASVGATYEIPGSDDALQDVGDGEFHLFMTGGKRLYNGNAHWLSAFGVRLPVDDEVQTESIHWSNHFDVRLTDSVYLLTEVA